MTEVERIADQLKRSFDGESWHGPAVQELLEDVGQETASRRPIAMAHSIWELVLHMITWKEVVLRRLNGDPARDIPLEVNFPPVGETSASAWDAARERLESAHRALERALGSVRDEQLEQSPAPGVSTRYVLLHGIIQHDLYHAGQIAILKKD